MANINETYTFITNHSFDEYFADKHPNAIEVGADYRMLTTDVTPDLSAFTVKELTPIKTVVEMGDVDDSVAFVVNGIGADDVVGYFNETT